MIEFKQATFLTTRTSAGSEWNRYTYIASDGKSSACLKSQT